MPTNYTRFLTWTIPVEVIFNLYSSLFVLSVWPFFKNNIGITTISKALWSIMIAKLWIMSELDVSFEINLKILANNARGPKGRGHYWLKIWRFFSIRNIKWRHYSEFRNHYCDHNALLMVVISINFSPSRF